MTDNLLCHQFEDLLSGYLENALERDAHRHVAAHALRCPVCHGLLNEVKTVLQTFRQSQTPQPSPAMEARIMLMTQPETAMSCGEFEDLLTEYLDGFLPAALFHRWERHAVLCQNCTDLPGEVVRTIGVCYTAKADEIAVPVGLHERILQATLGTVEAETVKMPIAAKIKQVVRDFFAPVLSPVLNPQFASVATMLLLAFFIFANNVTADGGLRGMYQTGIRLAERTYEQSATLAGGLNGAEIVRPDAGNSTSEKEAVKQ